LLNSLWLTAITFLCVGYGDIVPNTYCGRGITLTCGMVVSIPKKKYVIKMKIKCINGVKKFYSFEKVKVYLLKFETREVF
jgi:hypothetical protein